jgi:hypothetical protein
MANTYTPNLQLAMPASGDRTWNVPVNGNALALDELTPIGSLAVTTAEVPSATLDVRVAAGSYLRQDGSIASFAGMASQAIPASSTKMLYLDLTSSGALTVAAAWPTTAHVRLGTIATTSTTISSIADARVAFGVLGAYADGVNLTLGSGVGTQIATAAAQKLAFWGKTPVVQPAGAAQAALVDSTGGSIGTTLAAVTATNSTDQSAVINANFASVNNLLEALRAAAVAAGLIKGSA